ncbi:hypothetical protein H5410_022252 [Solanum commersonii]|uniref:Uncharacterized protein n=1 Tax=Solanum commersonii TaxID=4109 RepID=A0A9J5ZDF4_SOLCO|nr:hypothetical protein H5410_022252 [Solanum commersonii]
MKVEKNNKGIEVPTNPYLFALWLDKDQTVFNVLTFLNINSLEKQDYIDTQQHKRGAAMQYYWAEFWLVKNAHVQNMEIAEMRMFTWIYTGKIGKACGRQDEGCDLRWFEHDERRCKDALVRRSERLDVAGVRSALYCQRQNMTNKSINLKVPMEFQLSDQHYSWKLTGYQKRNSSHTANC